MVTIGLPAISLNSLCGERGFIGSSWRIFLAAGTTIIEKLERYIGQIGNVGFACVTLTPDDEGHIAGKPDGEISRPAERISLTNFEFNVVATP